MYIYGLVSRSRRLEGPFSGDSLVGSSSSIVLVLGIVIPLGGTYFLYILFSRLLGISSSFILRILFYKVLYK